MVDQLEDSSEARQVVGQARTAGIQPESAAGIVDSDAGRPFVRLKAQGVQVPGVGGIADQKSTHLTNGELKTNEEQTANFKNQKNIRNIGGTQEEEFSYRNTRCQNHFWRLAKHAAILARLHLNNGPVARD